MSKSVISILRWARIGMVAALLAVIILFMILGNRISNAEIEDVIGKVASVTNTEKMEEGTNRLFKKFYGLNAGDFEGVVLYSPLSNMDAEEVLLIKLKDQSQAEMVTDAIETRLETQKNSFEGYGIEQYALLENHILDVQGNYILFVVHPDAQKIDEAFRSSL